jgi:hypothetical protein
VPPAPASSVRQFGLNFDQRRAIIHRPSDAESTMNPLSPMEESSILVILLNAPVIGIPIVNFDNNQHSEK